MRKSPATLFSLLVLLPSLLMCEEGYKDINGTKLFYKMLGKGTPIVILHGGPGMDHTYFLPQMAELAKEHRLIFFDQRACGKSSVDIDTNSMTMKSLVEDVEGIRQAFKLGKMNLLGHSWGGLLAMSYAIRYPGNLHTLILSNPSPASSKFRDESFAIMADRTSQEDKIAQAAISQSDDFRKRKPEALTKFFRILFKGTFYNKALVDSLTLIFPEDQSARSKITGYLSKDSTILTYDIFPQLKNIACPTLIIGGDFDQVPKESNEMLHAEIKGSILIMLRNCGHFPFIEQPKDYFTAIRAFLRKAK